MRTKNKRFDGKSYWIIGASSGIGEALAKEMSTRGARVILSGRSSQVLNDLAQQIGPQAVAVPCDVCVANDIQNAYSTIREKGPIDGVIYMAGIFTPMSLDALDIDETVQIITTNLTGAFYVVSQVLPEFLKRKAGQIVLSGSVMGYRGLAHAQPYAATKACLINFAESLRAECMRTGVDVKIINPGFVRTPMTEKNNFCMPAIIDAQTAGIIIADSLHTKAFEIHFPKRFTLFMKLLRFTSVELGQKIFANVIGAAVAKRT